MKIVLKWIEEIVGIKSIDYKDFDNTLKSLGIGVEEIIDLKRGKFTGVEVVGKSRGELKVYDGTNTFVLREQVSEVEKGDILFLNGKSIVRKKDIGFGSDEIVKINTGEKGIKAGDDFYDIYGNIIFDLEVPANRFDVLSHLGIAREFASHHNIEWKEPDIKVFDYKRDEKWGIKPEDTDLLAYTGVRVENINIRSSTFRVQWKLFAAGLRPINNIVDITNYILLKYGQPLHAFDLRFLDGTNIIVRRGRKGEKIRVIGGVEVELNEEVMIIADEEKPLAIAGIIGGEDSEVREDTHSIILECADFSPPRIKRGTQNVKIITDSSKRFETRIDPIFRKRVLSEAIEMIQIMAEGNVVGMFDYEKEKFKQRKVTIDPSRIQGVLGMPIGKDEIVSLIERFNFKVKEENSSLNVYIPSFRHDIIIEEDMIEEIARIKGYDSIPEDFHIRGYGGGKRESISIVKNRVKNFLTSRGFFEAINLSFCNVEKNKLFSKLTPVDIINPISDRWNQMRTSIIPSLLDSLRENLRYGIKDVRVFEMGRIYWDKGEEERLSLLITGKRSPVFWRNNREEYDIFDIKGILEDIMFLFNVDYEFIIETPEGFSTGGKIGIKANGKIIYGIWGEIDRSILEMWDVKSRVFAFEIPIHNLEIKEIHKPEVIKFPLIERDLSFLLNKELNVYDIMEYIKKKQYFDEIHIFDYYSGKGIPLDKKVVGFRLVIYPVKQDKDKEVDDFISSLVNELENKFKIQLRGGKNGRNFEQIKSKN